VQTVIEGSQQMKENGSRAESNSISKDALQEAPTITVRTNISTAVDIANIITSCWFRVLGENNMLQGNPRFFQIRKNLI